MANFERASHLERVIRDTEELLGIHITIHDITGTFRNPDGEILLAPLRMRHQYWWCHPKKDNANLCRNDCQLYVGKRSKMEKRPWLHVCWNGIAEVIVPVYRHGAHLATIFAGAFRPPRNYQNVTTALPERKYAGLPEITTEKARQVGSALIATGQGLLALIEELHQLDDSRGGRESEIRRFFHYRATSDIRLGDLAAFLNLSPYRTSHLVKELFGEPFRTILLKERINRARALLLSGVNRSVGEIARQVGMPDEYHFNRMFRKIVGVPPGKYRRANSVKTER